MVNAIAALMFATASGHLPIEHTITYKLLPSGSTGPCWLTYRGQAADPGNPGENPWTWNGANGPSFAASVQMNLNNVCSTWLLFYPPSYGVAPTGTIDTITVSASGSGSVQYQTDFMGDVKGVSLGIMLIDKDGVRYSTSVGHIFGGPGSLTFDMYADWHYQPTWAPTGFIYDVTQVNSLNFGVAIQACYENEIDSSPFYAYASVTGVTITILYH